MKLDQEARVTMKTLAARGHSRRSIARMLAVDESTVRYHLGREGRTDGRSKQAHRVAALAEPIATYIEHAGSGPLNMAALHDWLRLEHDYTGSLRSVQRYVAKHFPKPARRARRRVETPPGAQAQVDWAEWPRLSIGGVYVYGYEFHMRLSYSRYGARVWSPRKDQLAWNSVHGDAFRRLDGIPATIRVDNEKTAMSRGAGSWGERNPSYRRYAKEVRFHIDACAPRHPEAKGKVERGIRTGRRHRAITERHWQSWEELQAYTDEVERAEAATRMCPATGTTVLEAWDAEKPFLAPVPLLPEPFDLTGMRTVAHDCTVAFEGRRYSVPFRFLGQRIEVRGCSHVVQMWADGSLIAQHARHGRQRIVLDPSHFEGEATDTLLPPLPLGRMGRRLQEIAAMTPSTRPLDLYADLAEVAR